MSKIILFGGSFNPIHNGHLEMAKCALKQRNADEVWFIPNKRSPFKEKSITFDHRVQMMHIMFNSLSKFKVCTIENELPDPSYSFETVQELKRMYPEHEFEWMIGSDQLMSLDQWKNIEMLKQSIQFIVYQRPDFKGDSQFPILDGKEISTSSTRIRQGNSFDTDPGVLNYAVTHGLYLDELIQTHLSDFRYQHVCRVTDLALEIAEVHSVDLKKMYVAAMMHDFCKEWDKDDQFRRMQAIAPTKLNCPPALYHGFLAADFLSKKMNYTQKNVLRAIAGHVSGTSTHKIGQILYIADKCERGRNYDSEWMIEASKKNLNYGYKTVKQEQEKYLRRTL